MKHPISKALITIAAGGVLLFHLGSNAVKFRVSSDGDKISWEIEGQDLDWRTTGGSFVVLAALYTGRIDWVIDAAESMAKAKARSKTKD